MPRDGLDLMGATTAGELDVEVDLEVPPGETLAILGPNGSGKTTLLQVIAGLRTLVSGHLALAGRMLDAPGDGTWVPPEDRSVGVVFQDLLLFPHLDVLDNVAFGLRSRGSRHADARRDALPWLDGLGIGELADALPSRLSGGEAQRVALARALAPGPAALLLDEPLSALDADVRSDVRRQLRSHLAGFTGPCIVVTHDPLDAAVLADRVVVLESGHVTAEGSLDDLVARPRTPWAAELAGTNLLRGTAHSTQLVLEGGGRLIAADHVPDGPVLIAVRPASVAIHVERPTGSPRNVWDATVVEIEGVGERVRVRLAGTIPLVAEVTVAAVDDLGLRLGSPVWASVKATELVTYPG
jgi:molybdate transport system ATP-binding protein